MRKQKFQFDVNFNRRSLNENVSFSLITAPEIPYHCRFNRLLSTVVYVNGLFQASEIWLNKNVQKMTNAYTIRGGYNYVLLDYAGIVNRDMEMLQVYSNLTEVNCSFHYVHKINFRLSDSKH